MNIGMALFEVEISMSRMPLHPSITKCAAYRAGMVSALQSCNSYIPVVGTIYIIANLRTRSRSLETGPKGVVS